MPQTGIGGLAQAAWFSTLRGMRKIFTVRASASEWGGIIQRRWLMLTKLFSSKSSVYRAEWHMVKIFNFGA